MSVIKLMVHLDGVEQMLFVQILWEVTHVNVHQDIQEMV